MGQCWMYVYMTKNCIPVAVYQFHPLRRLIGAPLWYLFLLRLGTHFVLVAWDGVDGHSRANRRQSTQLSVNKTHETSVGLEELQHLLIYLFITIKSSPFKNSFSTFRTLNTALKLESTLSCGVM